MKYACRSAIYIRFVKMDTVSIATIAVAAGAVALVVVIATATVILIICMLTSRCKVS